MNEKTVELKIRKAIKDRGGKLYKLHGTQFSVAGAPDLLGCCNGTPFAIEVKAPGNKPTPRQQLELDSWRAQGWATGVAHSVDEAIAIIEAAPCRLQLTMEQMARDVEALLHPDPDDDEEEDDDDELCECGRRQVDCTTFDQPEGEHEDR